MKRKPKKIALRPGVPEGATMLLEIDEIVAALGISRFHFSRMRGKEYPEPDVWIGRLPRWKQSTHNDWVEKRRAQ